MWSDGYWHTGGKTVVNPGVALTIDTATASALLYAHTLENHGDITWSGVRNLAVYSTWTIPMTIDNWGTWDIRTDADMDYGASLGQNTINNWGAFRKTAGSGETVVLADFNNKNGGALAVDAGSIFIKSNDLVNDRGGTVIIGLDRRLGVDRHVTNNGKIQHTQSSTANAVRPDHQQLQHHAGTDQVSWCADPKRTDMGQTTVTVWGNQHCGIALPSIASHLFGATDKNASYTVLRCYEITPTTPQTADITFYYLANTASPPWPSYWPDERNANSDPYAWHHNDARPLGHRGPRRQGQHHQRLSLRPGDGRGPYSPFALLDDTPSGRHPGRLQRSPDE